MVRFEHVANDGGIENIGGHSDTSECSRNDQERSALTESSHQSESDEQNVAPIDNGISTENFGEWSNQEWSCGFTEFPDGNQKCARGRMNLGLGSMVQILDDAVRNRDNRDACKCSVT